MKTKYEMNCVFEVYTASTSDRLARVSARLMKVKLVYVKQRHSFNFSSSEGQNPPEGIIFSACLLEEAALYQLKAYHSLVILF